MSAPSIQWFYHAPYLESIRSDCSVRTKVVLQLLGDDFLVNVPVRYPVSVQSRSGRHVDQERTDDARKCVANLDVGEYDGGGDEASIIVRRHTYCVSQSPSELLLHGSYADSI